MISLAAPVTAGAPPEAPNSETEVTLAAHWLPLVREQDIWGTVK